MSEGIRSMSDNGDIVITVERRKDSGTSVAKKLRREGMIPAVVYGGSKPPYPISVSEDVVKELLRKHGENTLFLLKVKGTKDERQAMIKASQVHPISGKLKHIDFIRVTKGHLLTVTVPVELNGDSVGVRLGGRLDFITRDLQVEVMPRHLFNKFVVDISDLEINDNITVADLESQLPESGKFLEDAARVILQIEAPRLEEEEEEEDEGLVVEASAEPELIKKGKDEEESE
jgi:large subunit ribosomal protein L25